MTRELRWRIITLQVVVIALFAFLAGAGYWASSFTHDQVTSQLATQQIAFPADAKSGLPDNLQQYAGQQVLNGEQAHAYAENYIGMHLQTIGKDDKSVSHPYSYWSGVARNEKDPTLKAKYT